MADDICPIQHKPHSWVQIKYPTWPNCVCNYQFSNDTSGHASSSAHLSDDDFQEVPASTFRPRVKKSMVISKQPSPIPRATKVSLSQAYHVAVQARNNMVQQDGLSRSSKMTVKMGLHLYGGQRITSILGRHARTGKPITTTKWNNLSKKLCVDPFTMPLHQEWPNHDEFLSAVFDKASISHEHDPLNFRIVGQVTTGNGASVHDLPLVPSSTITVHIIRDTLVAASNDKVDSKFYLNVIAEVLKEVNLADSDEDTESLPKPSTKKQKIQKTAKKTMVKKEEPVKKEKAIEKEEVINNDRELLSVTDKEGEFPGIADMFVETPVFKDNHLSLNTNTRSLPPPLETRAAASRKRRMSQSVEE